jgi:phenylalanine-4-hydroxylase
MSDAPLAHVELTSDHPGFHDPEYRRRRNQIAAAAIAHRSPAPAPEIAYTDEERGVWAHVLGELGPLHAKLACREHLAAWPRVGFVRERLPQLAEISERLTEATGFTLQPVAGLVTPREFMQRLADGVFLATQYMRHHSRPLYTPEPDVVHELVGHAALLTDPRMAQVNRLFGEATRRADEARVQELIRVYWYALEFGLVLEDGAPKAIGAGLLSSFGELERFSRAATLRPFSIAEIAATPFDTTAYQTTLFVAPSSAVMLAELTAWLER